MRFAAPRLWRRGAGKPGALQPHASAIHAAGERAESKTQRPLRLRCAQLAQRLGKAAARRRCNAELPHLPAQQVGNAGIVQAQQRGTIERRPPACRLVLSGELVEQARSLVEMLRCARQRRHGARESLLDSRDDAMADVVAGKTAIDVALVLDPGKRVRSRPGFDLRASQAEQRPQAPGTSGRRQLHRRHRRGATHSRAAKKAEQQGFGLIVLMMAEGQPVAIHLRQRGMARFARRRFGALGVIAPYVDAKGDEGHFQPCAQFTAEREPVVGVRAEPVVDVGRAEHKIQSVPQLAQAMQQDDRIDAAGKAAAHPAAGSHAGLGQHAGDRIGHVRRPAP